MVRNKRPDPQQRELAAERRQEKRRSKDLSLHSEVALAILENLDCPRALTIAIMIRYGMWDEIANMKFDPSGFDHSEPFFRAYQATKLLSKAEWLPTSIDKLAVAKTKFHEAEALCRETNRRWLSYRQMTPGDLFPELPDYEAIFSTARRKIGKVLGDNLYKWTELCDFGPGADGSTAAGMTSAYNKLSLPGCVTFGAYHYLNTFAALTSLGRVLGSCNIETRRLETIEISRGNSVTFVSKNAKTDRPIAVEPRWNMFMQKGVGRFLRNRLKLFGVNLDFQGLNQALAIYGSRTGKYGTLDLASASDTVSKELVRALMPEPWLHILDCLRSHSYYLDGKWSEYEKWSSMGNGYTFELESLLFWALASSVDEDISVYGDDLIVPSESYEKVVRVLEVCGFRVNPDKSYVTGYFRESCGEDAFNGDPVTPIYWKERLHDTGTLTLVNQISTLATKLGDRELRAQGLKKVWKGLVYQLPKRFQTRGPTTLSTVVHDSSTKWNAVRQNGWDGVFLRIYLPVARRFRYADWEAAVVSQNFQPSSDGYVVRDRVV
jgi:hypothetical protein